MRAWGLYKDAIDIILGFLLDYFDRFYSVDKEYVWRWVQGTSTVFMKKASPATCAQIRHHIIQHYVAHAWRSIRPILGSRLQSYPYNIWRDYITDIEKAHRYTAATRQAIVTLIDYAKTDPVSNRLVPVLELLLDKICRPLCTIPFNFLFGLTASGEVYLSVRLRLPDIIADDGRTIYLSPAMRYCLGKHDKTRIDFLTLPKEIIPKKCEHGWSRRGPKYCVDEWCGWCRQIWDSANAKRNAAVI